MAVYLAEPIDISDLKTLFENNWDQKTNTEIPQPEFTISAQPREDPSLAWGPDARRASVNIHLQEIKEDQDGYAYAHVKIRAVAVLEIWTRREAVAVGGSDRQYLHDVKQELRRIIFGNRHSLANWQIMKYQGFEEDYKDSGVVRFHGRIRINLENDAIAVANELVDEDLFNRANGALGAEWTFTGTWEVVSNQAALQSATAGAIARFTPTTTFKANHRVSVDVVTSVSMEAGLIFRYQDASNFWRLVLVETGGVRFIRLIETVATVDIQVAEQRASADASLDWTAGDTVQIEICLNNSGMAAVFNGMAVIQREDTFLQTATVYGLYSNSDQLTRLDNFGIFETGGAGR